MNYELARHHMIQQQLRTAEVLGPDVVDMLYADRREEYAPAAHRALAFADCMLPLGGDAVMLTPKLEARILQVAGLAGGEAVLEIGAGSGHMAALLAEAADHVWTVEIDAELAARARANLENDGVGNVTVVVGDGLAGLPAHAPYDLVVVSGGVAEIPAAPLAQLKPGGRLLAFVAQAGLAPIMVLRRVERVGENDYRSTDLLETAVPMLRDAPAAARFVF